MPLRDKGPTLVGVLWLEVGMCLLVLGLRIYTRTVIRRSLGVDDLLLVISWLLMVAFAALCTAAAMTGMGTHYDKLSPDEFSRGMLFLLAGQSVVSLAMGLSKCAVAAFLMRILVKTWHKAFLWFWNISIMILSIFLSITVFVQCTPVESIWDPRVPKKGCSLNLTVIATVMCAWSAVLDFVLALFPWVALWDLNMKKKEKITICLSLSLGIFAGVCGIIRTTGLYALADSTDYLYATTDSVIWTNSEMTTTMICVSIPALRPLYRYLHGNNSFQDDSGYSDLPASGKSSVGRSKLTGRKRPTYTLDSLVTTTVQGKSLNDTRTELEADERSDDADTRQMLNYPNGYNDNNIHQVNEVTVSYDERRPGESQMPPLPVKARQHV
ncbi:uncharacterized protein BDW47DRAFT_121684 [Aspergillus candidus]|uniref:Rhodopsin domain-containing protein n=1 Tax=Aspergillus candidus TaxID=41067 RepID=A0A2I2FPM8_ASPCN|nr:hypothetical protein BDW47DRAFT_121684 [Aspergillus candidus]PLB42583.1 hypothetical protein BDW47DRAFT_121684 [Aspergillus candidus]